jgi:UDP-2,3-diacylglucosamine pyrophosphatase LpxH
LTKFKIIVSDMHLGAGYGHEGNRLEDFDQDGAFAELVRHLVSESERLGEPMELVFAGDTFEFLQVPALDAREAYEPAREYAAERYAPTDEASSRRKMDLIIQGHPLFFRSLRELLSSPLCSICFIKGNHDINLHWGQVQALIVAALGADRAPGRLTFEERCLSRESIYVEHGNQYLEWINRWADFEQPHDSDRPGELYLPAGSRFVYQFLNHLEYQYYWLDGVKPITALIWYLFALDYSSALRALKTLLRLVPSLIWGSLPMGWALSESLQSQEHVSQMLEDVRRMAGLDTSLKERSAFYNQVDMALDLYGVQRSGGPLGRLGVYGHAVLPRGQDEQRAQRDRLQQVASVRQAQENARVVVFGHVHEPCQRELAGGGQYLNAGSWTWNRDMTDADHVAWQDLFRNPDKYMGGRRLTYVRVDYDERSVPHAELRTFVIDAAPKVDLWRRFRAWIASREE